MIKPHSILLHFLVHMTETFSLLLLIQWPSKLDVIFFIMCSPYSRHIWWYWLCDLAFTVL